MVANTEVGQRQPLPPNLQWYEDVVVPINLYHYTTLGGLQSIIANKEIWATNLLYLNDYSEFVYASQLAIEVLRSEDSAFLGNDLRGSIISELERWPLQDHPSFRTETYVSCFSENGDQLSQWRGYCPHGGVSIGFDWLTLAHKLPYSRRIEDPGLLQGCIYSPDEQKKRIVHVLSHPFTDHEGSHIGHAVSLITGLVNMKHHSFKEEEEWRIAFHRPLESAFTPLKFRTRPDGLIPYTPVSLDTGDPSATWA
jgi:Protein of unknown function (DUF2971)